MKKLNYKNSIGIILLTTAYYITCSSVPSLAEDRATDKSYDSTAQQSIDRNELQDRLYKAFIKVQEKDFASAEEALNEILSIDPKNENALLILAGVYSDGFQDYKKGIETFQKVLEVNYKNSQAHLGIATNYAALGQFDLAIESAQEALKFDPKAPTRTGAENLIKDLRRGQSLK